MRTRKGLAAAALLLAGTAFAPAFDTVPEPSRLAAERAAAGAAATRRADAGAVAATRRALAAYRAGRKVEAARAFALAAQRGHVPAQWKLARMLAAGDGVAADPVRAAALFGAIAERFEDRDPSLALVPFVASAVREAGLMHLSGTGGARDVEAARRLLWRAATAYRDGEALYRLALSLADPADGRTSPATASAMLRSAAARGHARAGVRLGEWLVAGFGGTAADPVAGLVAMARAVEHAPDEERPSLALRFQSTLAAVEDAERVAVEAQLAAANLSVALAPVLQAEAAE